MDAERNQLEGARRALGEVRGPVLRATHRGVLVLQTEAARRMMERLRHLRAAPEPEPLEDPAGGRYPAPNGA